MIPIQSSGVFHPKIVILVGKKNARVFVGSHNTTLSGFGGNRELTTQFDFPKGNEDHYAPLAKAAWGFIKAWLNHPVNYIPQSIIEAAFRLESFAP